MRKMILGLLMTLFMAVTVPCQAWFHDDTDRWIWIDSNDEIGIFYDTTTIKYTTDSQRVDVWVCFYDLKEECEFVALQRIDIKNRKQAFLAINKYDKNGKSILNYTVPTIEWTYITPGSAGESIYNVVKNKRNK